MNVILSGVVGSLAYGLATPDSDVDRLGIFAAPTEALHGLTFPGESKVTTNPDRTLHECRKACRLMLGGNPTVSEVLWLQSYETRTAWGDELIRIRKAFQSAKRCRDAYLGYATSQFRKLEARGDGSFSADTRKRTAKHSRHLYRLCHQGLHLYRTGELLIRLVHPGLFREFGEQVAAGGVEVARRMLADYEEEFDRTRTPLPDRPDEETVERWLLAVRRAHLAVPNGVR